MPFILGARSLSRLVGVHPHLVQVVKRAILTTEQDFSVDDGVRTIARQRELVATNASKTMNSKHLRQADGYGHAVDLVPYVDGKLLWDHVRIRKIVVAMRAASIELGVPIVWGSIWDRKLSELPATTAGIYAAVEAYKARHPGPDFIDGPHYQLA